MASDRLRLIIGTLGFAAMSIACSDARRSDGATSSTILADPANALVWLTSPDDNAVVAIDMKGLSESHRVEVPGGPNHLVDLGRWFAVSLSRRAAIAWVDRERGTVSFAETPCGGTSGGATDNISVFFACPNDDRVIELVPGGSVLRVFSVPGRPSRVAIIDQQLVVTRARKGTVAVYQLSELRGHDHDPWQPTFVTPRQERFLETRRGFAATQVDLIGIDADTSGMVVGYQVVDHDSDRGRPAEEGGYGSVFDDTPRIEPRVLAQCGGRYARFDGSVRVQSGPSAVAASGGRLWIAHRATDTVSVHSCEEWDEPGALPNVSDRTLRLEGVFRVGRGPRGIALSGNGASAWVDVGFDHAVARLELSTQTGEPLEEYLLPSKTVRRSLISSVLSAEAEKGRRDFFDAVNTHLTPSGVVTCGTCHPGGGADGLSWFLHTPGVGRKLRRTQPAWGARTDMSPFHWDGEFKDGAALASTAIRELMNGDALLVDVNAIASFMAEISPPPSRPVAPTDQTAFDRGQRLFVSAGCASCHPAPTFQDGLEHRVISPSNDPDAVMTSVFTPTLRGVRAHPPYLHDGRAKTLEDVIARDNPSDLHGATSTLTALDRRALTIYLESL